MGHSAQRREHCGIRPLCRVPFREPGLAERRHAAPARRSRAAAGRAWPRHRARLLRQDPADDAPGPVRARPCAAGAGRPRRGPALCARGLALRRLPRGAGEPGPRCVRRFHHAGRPRRSHGRPALVPGYRGRNADGAAAWRRRNGHRQGASRGDHGYMFSRIQWLRRNERIPEAAGLLLAAPRDPAVLHNLDEWWIERRLICRKMLDLGDPQTAYRIARDAAPPPREIYRGEQQFTAGWIALRFLNDPQLAMPHFAGIAQGITNPITLARSEYWQGRAAEAAHRLEQARAHYEASARYPTAYYGQIARGRLGLAEIALRRLPELSSAQHGALADLDVLRAAEMLYAAGAHHLILPFVADLGDRMPDAHALEALARITESHEDARAMLLVGKGAVAQGLALDAYAFPTFGVPNFGAIGPEVDRSIIYSIVRQESAFDQNDVSTAQAMGLMQVTPEAGRHVACRFGVRYDQKKLRHDAVYNTQMGAAELGELLQIYRGSYILAFAAYNAGQGRVKEWLERYGDPRDPAVDPIDWVERIPFAETRNYVERVMENLQVYRIRLGGGSRLMIEADLYRGAVAN